MAMDRQDNGDDAKNPNRSFGGLPSFGVYMEASGVDATAFDYMTCVECETPSARVRSYSLLTVALLPILLVWRLDNVMKGPRCMRRHVIARLPLTVLLSHVVGPFVVTWWLVVFAKTFFTRRG